MAPHYGGSIVFMLHIFVLISGSRASVFTHFHFYLFLSSFSPHSINMKSFLPLQMWHFPVTPVVFHVFTYKRSHLSPSHVSVSAPLPLNAVFAGGCVLCQPPSLPPPAGIFCHQEFSLKCQPLTENFDVPRCF